MNERYTDVLVLWLTLLHLLLFASGSSNYCTKQQLYNSTTLQPYQVSKLVTSEYPCNRNLICTRLKPITYTAYRTVLQTKLRTIFYCCPGWGGALCDTEVKANDGVAGVESNAVELEVPVQAFGGVSTQNSRYRKGVQGSVKVIFPLCLLALVAALLLVVIYSKRRYNLFKRNLVDRGDHVIAYSAAPCADADSPSSNTGTECMLLPATDETSELERVKCRNIPMRVDLADQVMSYRARMNNLNREPPQPVVEEKILNTGQIKIRLNLPANTPTAVGVGCDHLISDDEN